ncbi:MAG: hypothetical protein E6Q59_08060 [Nitrosomonas sp.]|nr:MAG: hypothetical protein E6Q59_08060 [Nitrosomonas sp.]
MTQHVNITLEHVHSFAAAWYQALDFHAPTEEVLKMVADENLQMIFPERTLHGINDFVIWYAGGTYSDGESTRGVINIFFDEKHSVIRLDSIIDEDTITVQIVVAWQTSRFVPPAARSERIAADFTQEWTLRRSNKNHYGLVIESYNAVAVPPVYAPGFSRL